MGLVHVGMNRVAARSVVTMIQMGTLCGKVISSGGIAKRGAEARTPTARHVAVLAVVACVEMTNCCCTSGLMDAVTIGEKSLL